MPSVSVIIPTWNRAGRIEVAVRSALNQTRGDLEVLVCDDGSTDDTARRLAAIGDRRVRWLPGPRGGRPAIPRNRGLKESTGEWIAFLDSDDEWVTHKLDAQLTALNRSSLGAICSNANRILPGEQAGGVMGSLENGSLTFDALVLRNRVICSSVVLHRSLLARAEGFPEDARLKVGEDYALWLRIATATDFEYLAEPLVNYEDDAANSVRANSLDGWSQRIEVMNDCLNWASRVGTGVGVRRRLNFELRMARFRRSVAPFARLFRPRRLT